MVDGGDNDQSGKSIHDRDTLREDPQLGQLLEQIKQYDVPEGDGVGAESLRLGEEGYVSSSGQTAATASAVGKRAERKPAPIDESQKVKVKPGATPPLGTAAAVIEDPASEDIVKDVNIKLPTGRRDAPTRLGRDPELAQAIAKHTGQSSPPLQPPDAPVAKPAKKGPPLALVIGTAVLVVAAVVVYVVTRGDKPIDDGRDAAAAGAPGPNPQPATEPGDAQPKDVQPTGAAGGSGAVEPKDTAPEPKDPEPKDGVQPPVGPRPNPATAPKTSTGGNVPDFGSLNDD